MDNEVKSAEITVPRIPTLCLNMIVKNESKIITRLFDSVAQIIDSYCICDTGSTDNTVELIETYLAAKNIPGKVVVEPFRDFGYSRTFALHACTRPTDHLPNHDGLSDYILLLDADMVFWLNPQTSPKQFKQKMLADSYTVFQGMDHYFYKNVRVVKNRPDISYWGVTHEFVSFPPNCQNESFDRPTCFIYDIGDGGCKTDKFVRDIQLLTKGLEEVPNNERYTFYLANSYRDAGQTEKAIEMFKKRIELGGWVQEIWHSYYSIGQCYKRLNDMPNAVYYWLEAYNYFPDRIENLYEVIQYYRMKSNHKLAYAYYVMADHERNKTTDWDHLFLQKDVYDYKIDYEMTILGYYCNRDNYDLHKMTMKVLAHPGVEDHTCKNILNNYKFYPNELAKWAIPLLDANRDMLQMIGQDKDLLSHGFVSSTPSICLNPNNSNILTICTRYVNYKINDKGEYINKEHIETKNILATINMSKPNEWKKTSEFVLQYDTTYDNLYVGLEDVRIMYSGQDLCYMANRGLDGRRMVLEKGTIDLTSQSTNIPCQHLQFEEKQQKIEKNWVIFEDPETHLQKCIYNWSPITIGDISGNQFVKTHEIKTPNFFKYVRGSTCGVTIGDEIWFINHVVSYEDRRYYYHTFTVLDRNTYKLKKYTTLWTFEKNQKVEYTLGFVYMKHMDRFLIGYSIMDRESKYMMVSKKNIDDIMIHV